jgi:hypothetical protein
MRTERLRELELQVAERDTRIRNLETALQLQEFAQAQAWALVLNHEGHLDTQDQRIRELERACAVALRRLKEYDFDAMQLTIALLETVLHTEAEDVSRG